MKLIESKAEYIPQEEGLDEIYKQIELAGRTAYHSQDKITPDSAKDFVDRMIKSKHYAALEHGTVYLMGRFSSKKDLFEDDWAIKYIENPYTKTLRVPLDANNRYAGPQILHITTNYRVLIENDWLDDLKQPTSLDTAILYNPTDFHERRYTFRFTCSRAIANELVRHRVFSFLQESTRYINYSRGRHGGEITFIKPSWLNVNVGKVMLSTNECWKIEDVVVPDNPGYLSFVEACAKAEYEYFNILKDDCSPQQARDVLPNATKTELIMTGFASDWRYLLDLRLFEKTGKVAPDMLDLMQKLQRAAQEAGIWDDIMKYPSKFE